MRGCALPVFSKQSLVTENNLVCGREVQGVDHTVISLGTQVSKHISSDLLCTGLPRSTFTPPRDNARPAGMRGPSHRDIWDFLLLPCGWIPRAKPPYGRPSGKLSITMFQAASQSSPAGSVQHPTGLGYSEAFIQAPVRLQGEPANVRNSEPGLHPGRWTELDRQSQRTTVPPHTTMAAAVRVVWLARGLQWVPRNP